MWLLFEDAAAVALIGIVVLVLLVKWTIQAALGVRDAFAATKHLRR